ncbi:MAG: helix-turn-helix transcriptional regulator [Bacteroides sp.]|nr:helix-turn-helix transcriptional regulator [Bacteroides sp.]MCM1550545.1 helix-turn-helix transcriptional regulator [Clostridium sp.]
MGQTVLLADLRKRKNMTQKDLANILKVSSSAVGMWESGKRKPTLACAIDIARIFNVRVEEISFSDNDEFVNHRIISENIWNTYKELRRQGKIREYFDTEGICIGLPEPNDAIGGVYECYEDFFFRKKREEKSDFERLMEEINVEINVESINRRTISEDMWNTYEELRRKGIIEDWVYINDFVYVGLAPKPGDVDKRGKIYECYEDFFLRKEGEEKSDFERLIEEIKRLGL